MTTVVSAPPGSSLSADEILVRSGSNFRAGFVCLDAERRAGMTAIYAFCRVADDAVDDAPDLDSAVAHLAFWRAELRAAETGQAKTPAGRALAVTMRRFQLTAAPLEALLDGCEMDIEPRGYDSEADLRLYCDRVASAVGRACLVVLGASGDDAVRYANALGQALQFTNILRDLRTDAESGRIYAPRDWLLEAGVEPNWLLGTGPDTAYRAGGPLARLNDRFVAVAEAEFSVARAALRALPLRMRRSLVAARIMGAVYGSLLRRLTARGGDLRGPRAGVPTAKKLWLAAQVILGVRA